MEIYKRISSGNLSRWCFYLLSVSLLAIEVSLQETVEGFIGGSTVLPCSSKEHPHAIQDITVLWRYKYSQNVYGIINGKVSVEGQDPRYRNRADSFPEEYLRGNFSIKLDDLQPTDAGTYTCYIIQESVDHTVELQIKEKPERQLPSEGTKPRPEMILMIISILCICVIFH